MSLVTSLLNQISGLFSKPFLIGAFLPVLLAAGVDAALLGWLYPPLQVWLTAVWAPGAIDKLMNVLLVVLPVFVFSYVVWSMNPALLALMEGRILTDALQQKLRAWQQRRFNAIQREVDEWRDKRRALTRCASGFEESLRAARKAGKSANANSYPGIPGIETLRNQRQSGEVIEAAEFRTIGTDLEKALRENNADLAGPKERELDRDHIDFVRVLKYAEGRAEAEYLAAYTKREHNFSYYQLAPTTMGNIAESVRGYALSRYSMDINIFWGRLLSVIQHEKEANNDGFADFFADQKGQVDFLVALFWLAILSNVVLIFFIGTLAWTFLPLFAILLLGPPAVFIFYYLAVMKYRDFADVQRTAIDLFRLKLLDRLNLPAPQCTDDERRLWDALTQRLAYREDVNLTYQPSDSGTPGAGGDAINTLKQQLGVQP